jgi:putative phosphoribosyl transferase
MKNPIDHLQMDLARPSEVRIALEEFWLRAELAVPHDAEGLVILAEGGGSNHLSPQNRYLAKVLRECGCGTLLADLLTSEERAIGARLGDLRFDVGFLADRLTFVTEWTLEHSALSELVLGYCGHGVAASAALCASARLGTEIGAIVCYGARPDLTREELTSVRAAALLIVAERDQMLIDLNRRALADLCGDRNLVVVPSATHRFAEPGALEKVARTAAGWFCKYLSQPE